MRLSVGLPIQWIVRFRSCVLAVAVASLFSCSALPVQETPETGIFRYSDKSDVVCQMTESQILNRLRLDPPPLFQVQLAGSPTLIVYTARDVSGTDKNFLTDLVTRKTIRIPGNFDPGASAELPLLAIPFDDGHGSSRLGFYSVRALLEFGERAQPLLPLDDHLKGTHPSLSLLGKAGPQMRFRVLDDGGNGVEIRDYEISNSGSSLHAIAQEVPVCPNLRDQNGFFNEKLLSLAPGGQTFYGFDPDTRTWNKFQFRGKNFRCEKKPLDFLPRPFLGDVSRLNATQGEIAFSYSDRALTVPDLNLRTPLSTFAFRSVAYDLELKAYFPLPFAGKGSDTFSPILLPDGNALVLEKRFQDDRHSDTDLLTVDFTDALSHPVAREDMDRFQIVPADKFEAYQWLSQRWNERCTFSSLQNSRFSRLLSVLSLDRKKCFSLINSEDANIRNMNSLDLLANQDLKDELFQLCESLR